MSHPQLLLDSPHFLYRYPGYHVRRPLPFIGPSLPAGWNNPVSKRLEALVSSSTMQVLLAGRRTVMMFVSSAHLLPGQIHAITCLPLLHQHPLLNTSGCLPWPFVGTWQLYQ